MHWPCQWQPRREARKKASLFWLLTTKKQFGEKKRENIEEHNLKKKKNVQTFWLQCLKYNSKVCFNNSITTNKEDKWGEKYRNYDLLGTAYFMFLLLHSDRKLNTLQGEDPWELMYENASDADISKTTRSFTSLKWILLKCYCSTVLKKHL